MKIKIKKSDWLYVGFIILVIRYCLFTTQIALNPIITDGMIIIGIICMLVKISCTKYERNEWIFFVFMFMLAALFLGLRGDETFLILTIVTIAMKKSDIRSIVKCWTYCYIVLFAVIVISSIIVGQDVYTIGRYEGIKLIDVKRYAFGFSHPNGVLAAFFRIICGIVYLDDNKNKKKLVMLEIIALILYYYTKSRTGIVCISIFLILCYVIQKMQGRLSELRMQRILFWAEIVVILFDFIAVYTYGKSKIIVALDYLLTGRFSLASRMMEYIPYSLFGTNMKMDQLPFSLDNSIWYVILIQGIILFLILTFLYCWGISKFGKEKLYLEANIVFVYTMYSICENVYSFLFLNIGLILVCYYWSNGIKKRNAYR